MEYLSVRTSREREVVDITERVRGVLPEGEGVVVVFVKHTTAAVTTADLDPGTDEDMLEAWEAMIPNLAYRHPHDPSHVGDHIMASLLGPSVSVPFECGELCLGRWQRVVLVELDGPRERELVVSFLK